MHIAKTTVLIAMKHTHNEVHASIEYTVNKEDCTIYVEKKAKVVARIQPHYKTYNIQHHSKSTGKIKLKMI